MEMENCWQSYYNKRTKECFRSSTGCLPENMFADNAYRIFSKDCVDGVPVVKPN